MSDKPWYESSDNVLALAHWRRDKAEESGECNAFCDRAFVTTCMDPGAYLKEWNKYQASLNPAEPTLSERIENIQSKLAIIPETWNPLLSDVRELAGVIREQAQRLEALEAKEREL